MNNLRMITKLINKDWQLYRKYMYAYIGAGLVSALIMAQPSEHAFYIGSVMLVTAIIAAGCHLSISLVVIEKKEYQLSFIMGLPISATDYSLSKIVGGLAIFSFAWVFITAFGLIAVSITQIPNGLLPLFLLCSIEMLAAFTLLLCISVLSGSEAITIVSMVLINLGFNIFLFSAASSSGIGPHTQGDTAVWNDAVYWIAGGEVLFIVLVVAIAVAIQSRKPCFL